MNSRYEGSIHEQDPHEWWNGVCQTLRAVLAQLKLKASPLFVSGIVVASTSGSLLLADRHGDPVRPAILYDDARGSAIAGRLRHNLPSQDVQYNSSYSVIKAAWVQREEPAVWERVSRLLHPADWLTGKFTGLFDTTDFSNALKLGFDSEHQAWGQAVSLLKLPLEIFPRVVRPGTQVGRVSALAAEATGLEAGIPVLAGTTDGMASLIASGARNPHDANTTLGTTIVWKVLSKTKPRLAEGTYCHRHPADIWAPGAASNSGPGSLRPGGASLPPAELDRLAAEHLPSSHLCYMLPAKGERFPFLNPQAVTFFEGTASTPGQSYAAQLQSLAFIERWGYERLRECGVTAGHEIYSTGSAAASPVLSQLRAQVLQRRVLRCLYPASAFGAAILAASETFYAGDLKEAITQMTKVHEHYDPDRAASEQFDVAYHSFRSACMRRGYV
jgi:sugar (pentulose or hexulose) kinase